MSDKKTPAQIEDPSRRDILRTIGLALTTFSARPLDLEAGCRVHALVHEETKTAGSYKPKFFNDHEYKTVQRLAELIVPPDNVSGSGKDAGAPEFIDLLCSRNTELAEIYTGGVAWLDGEMTRRFSAGFLEAAQEQQIALLEAFVAAERQAAARRSQGLSYEGSKHYRGFGEYGFLPATELGPGLRFFDWIRKMTVDAFYTSEIGIKDVGFMGNQVLVSYEVPKASLDHALNRSPFKSS